MRSKRRTTRRRAAFRRRDTGIGIPPDKQQLIFEPFTQADSSTTRRFGGTGWAWRSRSDSVELMGGEIWVESEPGKGSTFHFTAAFGLPQPTAGKQSIPTPVELARTAASWSSTTTQPIGGS